MLSFLRNLFRRPPPPVRWARPEYEAEQDRALKLGFDVTRTKDAFGLSYLNIMVMDEEEFGAVLLVGQGARTAICHRSPKQRGGWQVSIFEGEDVCGSAHHDSLQECLDAQRWAGFYLKRIMTRNGRELTA